MTAFSVVEKMNAKADVLIVLGVVPQLEVANFASRLLQVSSYPPSFSCDVCAVCS